MTNLTEELQRLNELDAKRTQGEWSYEPQDFSPERVWAGTRLVCHVVGDSAETQETAAFIAAAPAAIALANKLHAENERLKKRLECVYVDGREVESADGIACRDETIAQLEKKMARYEALLVQAEVAIRTVIEDGVQVTEGPYKQHKNNKCAHGQWGYEGCEACVADYLQPTLTALHAAGIGRE